MVFSFGKPYLAMHSVGKPIEVSTGAKHVLTEGCLIVLVRGNLHKDSDGGQVQGMLVLTLSWKLCLKLK